MKKKMILVLFMIFLCVCTCGDISDAKEKKFKRQDTKFTYAGKQMYETSQMYCTDNRKVQYMRYGYNYNKKCTEFQRDYINGKKINRISLFKDRSFDTDENFFAVRPLDDNDNLIIMTNIYEKKNKVYIKEYDKKGNIIFKYTDDKNLNNAFSLHGWDDGDNIYYTYVIMSRDENSYVVHTRSINKKNKKVKDMRSFKLNVKDIDFHTDARIRIEKGKIYVLCKEKINVYSLNGKLLKTCGLPGGEREIRIDIVDGEEVIYLKFNHFSVCGNYVYYCNRNGIYRWNVKGSGGFKLYYNAEGDEYFGTEYGAVDICVKDKNTIYIMFEDIKDYNEFDGPSKIVRYSR
ncbi:MAG: hypothetical protein HFH14_04715 [Lachnospiraceae bacterium]|nr:hypothetical protein [Lachnospiraceae bacterium]